MILGPCLQGQLREAECQYEEASSVRQEMAWLRDTPTASRERWKRSELSWTRGKRQTEAELGEACTDCCQQDELHQLLLEIRDVLRELSTPCRLRFMIDDKLMINCFKIHFKIKQIFSDKCEIYTKFIAEVPPKLSFSPFLSL